MNNLFMENRSQPLADRLRPKSISQIVGQDHLLGATAPIGRMLSQNRVPSMILWGPPGCGKTTLARLLCDNINAEFEQLSAVFSGVTDLRKVFERANRRKEIGQRTLLFIDEIHRFNKAQQDSFLPYVEEGTITLIGATTENPSFELNSALLSRCQVFIMNSINNEALELLMQAAEEKERKALPLSESGRNSLKLMADGDGRFLLNMVEELFHLPIGTQLEPEELATVINHRAPIYDKHKDQHFNLISALHKSLRGADPDAALYWLARMLVGGEDKSYIFRRLVRFASEDIGLADPNAITQALACWDAYMRLGSPEGDLALAQCVIYLATAPKSNAAHKALNLAKASAEKSGSLSPPLHVLNAPTRLMENLGYGKEYKYDHDSEQGFSGQNYFPDRLVPEKFYQPIERGFEREIIKRLSYWDKLRQIKNQ
ncbi:MAG: AAA family ATPase [Rhodospirillaceae bacterium]|nr:AAA family ATPase [Rhodospirillaceae bacterium]MDG1885731.1 replication-associated recombination protein A [Alphaproteobacteria bacterium]|tara:strand:- start:1473 stop:2762 length:1290 start_codon:yes stop_codon:yes gene_type:complete